MESVVIFLVLILMLVTVVAFQMYQQSKTNKEAATRRDEIRLVEEDYEEVRKDIIDMLDKLNSRSTRKDD